MLTKLTSLATVGLQGIRITVEVGATPGDQKMMIVGLGDTAVQESKQRVQMALRSCGYRLPTGRVVTINLAPADLKKVGPRYDLPMALGLLQSSGLIGLDDDVLEESAMLGELALDGTLRHVSGVLPATVACAQLGLKRIVVPLCDAPEAALIQGIEVIGAENLQELIGILSRQIPKHAISPAQIPESLRPFVDFADVRGQEQAKRALTIAAAGGHNVLLSGAPGAGKTLLAQALRGILPVLSDEEAIEVTQIYSVANLLPEKTPLIRERPFRMVHHTASGVAIVGGGQIPGPGEVSLAHRGVLFLDELAEFPPAVLEVLRQPLEDRTITITRAQGSVTFPADVLLVAAMNPPEWSASSAQRLQRRVSAPFLDRIDLTLSVQPVPVNDLQKKGPQGETSEVLRSRVLAARERQRRRFSDSRLQTNKEMGLPELREHCAVDGAGEKLLQQAVDRLKLSARGYHRTLKVARTIADLEGEEKISTAHLAEALQYRQPVGIER